MKLSPILEKKYIMIQVKFKIFLIFQFALFTQENSLAANKIKCLESINGNKIIVKEGKSTVNAKKINTVKTGTVYVTIRKILEIV